MTTFLLFAALAATYILVGIHYVSGSAQDTPRQDDLP